ncbi:dipeptide/oligopeptide/nickel ABC transporter ATP-binding protein [uncultured Bifidobacterium sp.]|uniref:ABC transporter ATP-binding protein n=1 Tax=uncultured Bifidobacterium sp. TaxID=165187 RepID=UPI0028DCE282|nr:dipeptide/oligopeptide/nickel ABC transporter ATP-binding protein [uncultured Bifidobacterium sp.]
MAGREAPDADDRHRDDRYADGHEADERNATETETQDGATTERPLLSARGLAVDLGRGRGRRLVLHGVDVDLFPGECLAIIGGSGSGKTTLVRTLLGLATAAAGEVAYRGLPVSGRRSAGWRALRSEAGLVFQNPLLALDPRWPLGRSVAEPLRIAGWRDSDRIAERVRWAMSAAGLDSDVFLPLYPSDVSGGQAQRAVIARALVLGPRLVVADEPMSSLDVVARMRLVDSLAAIRRAAPDMALLIVSHDLGVVHRLADRIVVLHDGRLEEEGPTSHVLRSPRTDYARALIAAATMPDAVAPDAEPDECGADAT